MNNQELKTSDDFTTAYLKLREFYHVVQSTIEFIADNRLEYSRTEIDNMFKVREKLQSAISCLDESTITFNDILNYESNIADCQNHFPTRFNELSMEFCDITIEIHESLIDDCEFVPLNNSIFDNFANSMFAIER